MIGGGRHMARGFQNLGLAIGVAHMEDPSRIQVKSDTQGGTWEGFL